MSDDLRWHCIYLRSRTLGVKSKLTPFQLQVSLLLLAIVVVNALSYQSITTHYVIAFDLTTQKQDLLANKKCNVQLSHCVCTQLPIWILISGLQKFL